MNGALTLPAATLLVLTSITTSSNSFAANSTERSYNQLFHVERLQSAIDAIGKAELSLRGEDGVKAMDLVCGSEVSLKIKGADGNFKSYIAKDFYSSGCLELVENLKKLGLKENGPIRVRFQGPNVFPGLMLWMSNSLIVYSPAGTGDRGVFKEPSN